MRAMKRSFVSQFASGSQPLRRLRGVKTYAIVGALIGGLGAAGCGSDGEAANADASSGGRAQGGDSGEGAAAAEGGEGASTSGGTPSGGSSSGGTSSGGSTTGGTSSGGASTGGSGDGGDGGTGNGTLTVDDCFNDISDGVSIDYDQYSPVMGAHCLGTDHQHIVDVERVVFLGDSVTFGTPPSSLLNKHFRALMSGPELFGVSLGTGSLENTFPGVKIDNCSKNGARTDDFLVGGGQVPGCWSDLFAGGQPKPVSEASDSRTTLVIFTMGGNDIFKWAEDSLEGQPALDAAEKAAQYLEDAIAFFKEPGRFPNGIHVIYGNPYEYTDATGDTGSCAVAGLAGLAGNQLQLAPAVTYFTERYLEIAVKYQADMIFMLENFCGHGYHHDDPASQCYRGPGAELWFDLTCIHPNDAGHAELARMFHAVIEQ